mmetsp:Transcript_16144/g.38287  ORF Transcript_16144/g.38287 Transcript_16144/m.38287 type:complete len:685 (+) Transcript_16144:477-2531(+)
MWFLCVLRSGTRPQELREFGLAELVASCDATSVSRRPFANLNTVVLKDCEPQICWLDLADQKMALEVARRCVLLRSIVKVWAQGESLEAALDGLEPGPGSTRLRLADCGLLVLPVRTHQRSGRPLEKAETRKHMLARIRSTCQERGLGCSPRPGQPVVAAVALAAGQQLAGALVGVVVAHGRTLPRDHGPSNPTGLGWTEALLTANLARVRGGSAVLDPFCGGCSLLGAARELGAGACVGSDTNRGYLEMGAAASPTSPAVGHGTDRLQADALQTAWRRESFDAIICDPPFGIRTALHSRLGFEGSPVEPVLRLAGRALRRPRGCLAVWFPLAPGTEVDCRGGSRGRPEGEARCGACVRCSLERASHRRGLAVDFLGRERRRGGVRRALAVLVPAAGGGPEGPGVALAPVTGRGGGLADPPPGALDWGVLEEPLPTSDAGSRQLSYDASKMACSGRDLDVGRAAWVGDVAAIEGFLASGGDVDAPDAKEQTALQYASGYGQLGVVQLLVSSGADVNRRSGNRMMSPLHRAASWGRADVVDYLLQAGADQSLKDSAGMSALHLAAQHGHCGALEALLRRCTPHPFLDCTDALCSTPLCLAARWGMRAAVRLLLEAGADPFGSGAQGGLTPAHLAAQWGHVGVLEELGQRAPRCLASLTTFGATPLDLAVEWQRAACAEYLGRLDK